MTGARIADNIAKHPEIYSGARQCIAALSRVRQRVGVALRILGRLYPQAVFPPVTIVVGRGKPMGIGSAGGGTTDRHRAVMRGEMGQFGCRGAVRACNRARIYSRAAVPGSQ